MNYTLSIDTSTPACSVALHLEGDLVGMQKYNLGKSHSSLLPGIIDQLIQNIGVTLEDLNAIAVCSGPGSYTGLRIGASVAKGLCYALDIPLISINSLQLITDNVFQFYQEKSAVVIASLDARREEVYTYAVSSLGEVRMSPVALVLTSSSYEQIKEEERILIAGDGAVKTKELAGFGENAKVLPHIMPGAEQLGVSAFHKFKQGDFDDTAYYEPFYLKEFYTTQKLKK